MFKALMKKVDNKQEQMGNFSREMENVKKDKMEILAMKLQ